MPEFSATIMRDNHTFRSLPLDEEKAMLIIREEFKQDGHISVFGRAYRSDDRFLHAHGRGQESWPAFAKDARKVIQSVIESQNDYEAFFKGM